MDVVLQFLNEPLVKVLCALLGGWLIKRNPNLPNRVIPLVNGVIAILVAAVANLFGPQDAHAGVAHAAKALGNWLSNPFVYGTLISVLTTGVHSTAKNLWQLIQAPQLAGSR